MPEYPSLDEQMRDAMRQQAQHRIASLTVDRHGWSRRQWADDAISLMGELHGSVTSLVNGHVNALIGELTGARQRLDQVRADLEPIIVKHEKAAESASADGDIHYAAPIRAFCEQVRAILDAAPADETGGA